MASTFSPLLRIELIGTGDQSGTWGSTTNVNLGTLIEQAIAGTATIDVSAGNVTLTDYNGTTDQARCAALRITGTPGTSRNVIAPATSKLYIIANGSDADVVLKTSTSTGLTVPTGEVYLAFYDTTSLDFRLVGKAWSSANTANTLVLRDASGNFVANTISANIVGNLNGNLTASAPTAPTQTAGDNSTKVATTAYVATAVTNATASLGTMSTQNANSVSISGGAITGATISGLAAALPVASGGTGVTSSTGTGSTVLSTSPTLTTPNLGTPTALVGTNITGTATALNAGIGVNQTWSNPANSHGTSYQNTTGKPIMVNFGGYSPAKNVWVYLQASSDNATWITVAQAFTSYDDDINGGSLSAIIPNGWYYRSAGTGWAGALWSVLS